MNLKKAREKKEMTQIEVAQAISVSVTAYRLWEQGGGNPRPENLKKLKKVLKIKD